jgi:hypothetical protein
MILVGARLGRVTGGVFDGFARLASSDRFPTVFSPFIYGGFAG